MASGSISARAVRKIDVPSSTNSHLGGTAIVQYNGSAISVCIRGVVDVPGYASTALINLPSGTAPKSPLYEDYVTSDGNHFRLIANTDGKFYVFSYAPSGTTVSDSGLNKTMTWAY